MSQAQEPQPTDDPTNHLPPRRFTAFQKLAILSELQNESMSVAEVARRHQTTHTSLLRWKRQENQLREAAACDDRHVNKPWTPNEDQTLLALQREFGNQWSKMAARLPARNRKEVMYRWHSIVESGAEIGDVVEAREVNEDLEAQPRRNEVVGGKRKRYNDEYTATEKLAVIRECKDSPQVSISAIAKKYGTQSRSIYRWKKEEEKLIQLVEKEGKGWLKRAGMDPLERIKHAIATFFYQGQHQNQGEKQPNNEPQVPNKVTGASIAEKAREVRDEILAEHELSPFLNDGEVKALKDFTASCSWGRKLIHKLGWKEPPQTKHSGCPMIDIAIDAANDYLQKMLDPNDPCQFLLEEKTIEAQAIEEGIEFEIKPTTKKLRLEMSEMKKEMRLLTQTVKKLQKENIELKKLNQKLSSDKNMQLCQL